MPETTDVTDNPEKSRFEITVEGHLAVAEYRIQGDRVVLTHTEVPEELSGKGVGSKLAQGVFEALRGDGRKVVATCPFMAGYAEKHPEYREIVEG